jgi:hypothetical protein
MTVLSKAALLANFADNRTGDISEKMLRDFVETMNPAYGSMYISTPVLTDITTQNVWQKAAGTTTDVNLNRFSGKTLLTVDNRLQYIGTPDIHVHGVVDFSSIASNSNKDLEYGVALNGTIIAHSVNRRTHGNTDHGIGACHFDTMLSTNHYLEIYVRNLTDVTDLTLVHAYMFVMGMLV